MQKEFFIPFPGVELPPPPPLIGVCNSVLHATEVLELSPVLAFNRRAPHTRGASRPLIGRDVPGDCPCARPGRAVFREGARGGGRVRQRHLPPGL